MGQVPKEAECSVAAELILFVEWETAASGLGRAASCVELVGKKGDGVQWKITWAEVLERMIEPEDEEVCLRYILKYSTRGCSNIFKLFDTEEKQDHFVAIKRRWMDHQEEKVALQESRQNELYGIKCQKPLRAPRGL